MELIMENYNNTTDIHNQLIQLQILVKDLERSIESLNENYYTFSFNNIIFCIYFLKDLFLQVFCMFYCGPFQIFNKAIIISSIHCLYVNRKKIVNYFN